MRSTDAPGTNPEKTTRFSSFPLDQGHSDAADDVGETGIAAEGVESGIHPDKGHSAPMLEAGLCGQKAVFELTHAMSQICSRYEQAITGDSKGSGISRDPARHALPSHVNCGMGPTSSRLGATGELACSMEKKLETVRRAAQCEYPVGDIDRMLAEIEAGYTAGPRP